MCSDLAEGARYLDSALAHTHKHLLRHLLSMSLVFPLLDLDDSMCMWECFNHIVGGKVND